MFIAVSQMDSVFGTFKNDRPWQWIPEAKFVQNSFNHLTPLGPIYRPIADREALVSNIPLEWRGWWDG